MSKLTRRTLLGALAAIPATAGPGRAFSATHAHSGVLAMIDAHRAARASLTAATVLYDEAFEKLAKAGGATTWRVVQADASDVEWEAFQALRDYRPADMGEVAAKARYLLSTIEVDEEGVRIANNAIELLRSLAA
ncbi:hypothetical protein NKH81_20405 [Mesorhizobium sp. M0959]|uniref:hypothetical protein n=1 Tax=Mesorhizobium sp. M0959 TaxID=2957034 RepID=UPI003339638B